MVDDVLSSQVTHALERALVRMYDAEQREYKTAQKSKWLFFCSVPATIGLHISDIELLFAVSAVVAGLSALAWVISWAAFTSAHEQISEIVSSLGQDGIVVGGEDRVIRLTKDPYDTPFGHAVGKWLLSKPAKK